MRWYTVLESWESVEGESSSPRGMQMHELFFLFSLRRVFSFFFFPHENPVDPDTFKSYPYGFTRDTAN